MIVQIFEEIAFAPMNIAKATDLRRKDSRNKMSSASKAEG
jgi:hypothetical protein